MKYGKVISSPVLRGKKDGINLFQNLALIEAAITLKQ
jgi:hypothetical protein